MREMIKKPFVSSVMIGGMALISASFLFGSYELVDNKTEAIRNHPQKETVADFRAVAKIAIPAVVAIKVQGTQQKQVWGNDSDIQMNNPYGGNDFWNYFLNPRGNVAPQQVTGQASGVIVSPDGYILTNSHVVHGMDSITVQMTDGREFPAKVLGDDPNSDLALIKIEGKNLPYLTLGNSDDLEVGQWVAAIGNPLGLQGTLTTGVVSAKSRNNLDIARYEDFIQTDASINRGNSGGPLVTLDGDIIGINTAIATNSSAGYMGIGFAIPSNMARHVMDEIISQGKVTRGFIGVALQSIDYNLAQAFNLPKVEGALVTSVLKNSPAEKAGLHVEDIILKYNNRSIENGAHLRNTIYMMKPGTAVVLTVLRKDKQIEIPLTVGDFAEETTTVSKAQKSQLGVEIDNLTPELARQLGYTQDQGVVITQVNPNSVAALAGLKKGALVVAVNRQKVGSVEQFNSALQNAPDGRPVLLQVKQGDMNLFVSLRAE